LFFIFNFVSFALLYDTEYRGNKTMSEAHDSIPCPVVGLCVVVVVCFY
jgi:hypothetical protein